MFGEDVEWVRRILRFTDSYEFRGHEEAEKLRLAVVCGVCRFDDGEGPHMYVDGNARVRVKLCTIPAQK